MRSTYSMHGSMADCSQEQTIFCLNFISISKGLIFLIYATHQYFTHYGSAYCMCNWKGIKSLKICLISKGLLFFIHPVERLHSFPRDQLNKSHGGHVGVPGKRVKLKFFWSELEHQHGSCDVMCKRSIVFVTSARRLCNHLGLYMCMCVCLSAR
jgi:hypothetical protein